MQEFKIKSRSDPDKVYTVSTKFTGEKYEFHCECKGFTYTGNCWHIKQIKNDVGEDILLTGRNHKKVTEDE